MKRFWRVVYPILIYVGVTTVVSVGIMLILLFLNAMRAADGFHDLDYVLETTMESYMRSVLLTTMISAAVSFPVLYWFFKRDQQMRGDGESPWKPRGNLIFLVLLGISACIAGNNLIMLSGLADVFSGFEEVSGSLYQSPLWVQILGAGVIIPIVEELTFRALGFRRMRDSMGFAWAAVISSLCFAVFHGNVVQGLYAFGIGFLMAWTYELYARLLAPILLHCTANITSVLLTESLVGELVYRNKITVWVSTAVMVILLAGCARYVSQYFRGFKEEEP